MTNITIHDLDARDIATLYTYSTDRVSMIADAAGETVVAMGYDTKSPTRTTGRVAWIQRRAPFDFEDGPGRWMATRCETVDGSVAMYSKATLDTHDGLDDLVRWLRGES